MRFIVGNKLYDTEKSEKILNYATIFKYKTAFGNSSVQKPTTLYKTEKDNWFNIISINESKQEIKTLNLNDVKKIFLDLNKIELYEKYFDKLEEA